MALEDELAMLKQMRKLNSEKIKKFSFSFR
jgi:hypothetical protein